MILTLGPSVLATNFEFAIDDANKKHTRNYDSIGVYLSGGIDSVALLILILTELKSTGNLDKLPITCYTVNKRDFSTDIAPKIVKLLEDKFDTSISHINDMPNLSGSMDNVTIKTFIDNFIKNRNRLFFVGINKMPPKELVSFKYTLKVNYGNVKDRIIYYSPFMFLHKPQILDIFYKLNCEDIIPYTYSCTVQPNIPCNNCYACEERSWGFKMLEKSDPLVAQNQLTVNTI